MFGSRGRCVFLSTVVLAFLMGGGIGNSLALFGVHRIKAGEEHGNSGILGFFELVKAGVEGGLKGFLGSVESVDVGTEFGVVLVEFAVDRLETGVGGGLELGHVFGGSLTVFSNSIIDKCLEVCVDIRGNGGGRDFRNKQLP